MAATNWDELMRDCQSRHQSASQPTTESGRQYRDGCAALLEIIPLLQQHFRFEDLSPVISLATLRLRTPQNNVELDIFCERPRSRCKVSYGYWTSDTMTSVDTILVNTKDLIPTIENYLNK